MTPLPDFAAVADDMLQEHLDALKAKAGEGAREEDLARLSDDERLSLVAAVRDDGATPNLAAPAAVGEKPELRVVGRASVSREQVLQETMATLMARMVA